tara:strand:+ start:497 stop:697 length:201 start_codon:yes stop_codon:yes gene_type:complete
MDELKSRASVVLFYAIRVITRILTIMLWIVGTVVVAISGLVLTIILLFVVTPVEWLRNARQNATGK